MKKILSFALALMLSGAMFAQINGDAYWQNFSGDMTGWAPGVGTTEGVNWVVDPSMQNQGAVSVLPLGTFEKHYLYSPTFTIAAADTTSGYVEMMLYCMRADDSVNANHSAGFMIAIVELNATGTEPVSSYILTGVNPQSVSTREGFNYKTIRFNFNQAEFRDSLDLANGSKKIQICIVHTGSYATNVSLDSNSVVASALVVDDFVIRKRADAFVVKFDAGDGTGTMGDMVTTAGGNLTAPACTFTAPTGKEFTCWYAYEYIEDSLYEYCIPAGDPVEGIAEDMVWTAVYAETEGIETAAMSALNVYPNPAHNMVRVNGVSVNSLEVLDMAGRLVMKNEGMNTINISNLSNGVYTLRINAAEGIAARKIVKK